MFKKMLTKAVIFIFFCASSFAQELAAKVELNFREDSLKYFQAKITSGDSAVKEIEVKFYVKRLFSLLPLGDGVETDENGMAEVIFPNDLPGDSAGSVLVIAKIEDDENYGTVEAQATMKWGIPVVSKDHWGGRSLSASREKAPRYLIIVSNAIIAGVWATLIFVIVQLFRIRKNSTLKT